MRFWPSWCCFLIQIRRTFPTDLLTSWVPWLHVTSPRLSQVTSPRLSLVIHILIFETLIIDLCLMLQTVPRCDENWNVGTAQPLIPPPRTSCVLHHICAVYSNMYKCTLCIYVLITHTHTHTHKHTRTRTHIHTHTYTHAHTHTRTLIVYNNACTHTHTHIHSNTHTPRMQTNVRTRTHPQHASTLHLYSSLFFSCSVFLFVFVFLSLSLSFNRRWHAHNTSKLGGWDLPWRKAESTLALKILICYHLLLMLLNAKSN